VCVCLCVCVCVLLVTQHSKRVLHIILPSVGLFDCHIFRHKMNDFRKKKSVIETKMLFICSANSVWNISCSNKNSARYYITDVKMSSCKVPVVFVGFNQTSVFKIFSKNLQISNFMNICSMGAKLFHRTDRHRHTWRIQ